MKKHLLSFCLLILSITGYCQAPDSTEKDTLYSYYKTKSNAEFKKIVPNVPWALGSAAVGTFFTVIDGSVLMGGVTFGGAAIYFTGAIAFRTTRGIVFEYRAWKHSPKRKSRLLKRAQKGKYKNQHK